MDIIFIFIEQQYKIMMVTYKLHPREKQPSHTAMAIPALSIHTDSMLAQS